MNLFTFHVPTSLNSTATLTPKHESNKNNRRNFQPIRPRLPKQVHECGFVQGWDEND